MWILRGPDNRERRYRSLERAVKATLRYPGSVLDSASGWAGNELQDLLMVCKRENARRIALANVPAQLAIPILKGEK